MRAPGTGLKDPAAPAVPRRFSGPLLATGAITIFTAAASWWLIAGSGPLLQCDSLAPLTVLATLAAFLLSVCFRQMGRYPVPASRWFLAACLLLAAATIFTDFRFVRRSRGFCDQLHQQMTHPAR